MIIRPLIYDGVPYNSYGVDSNTGDIYSFKRGCNRLRWRISGKSQYPQAVITEGSKLKNISVHKAVMETVNGADKPMLPGVKKSEWKNTPRSIKGLCDDLWEVNHIDHDPLNYSPKNLEWVTRRQNVSAYYQYRKCSNVTRTMEAAQ